MKNRFAVAILLDALLIGAVVSIFVGAGMGYCSMTEKRPEMMVDGAACVWDGIGRIGSGVFVGDDLVLTARHVIEDEPELAVELPDGSRHPAEVVRVSETRDLALLRVLTPRVEREIRLGTPKLGITVIHIGAPYGEWPTLTQGVVSCVDRVVPEFENSELVQVDFPAAGPGSSGGPVVDRAGRLIGVIIGGRASGLAFCIPAKQIEEFLCLARFSIEF